MTDKSTPKNKNPVKRKILAVVGIAIVLCSTLIMPISASTPPIADGNYPDVGGFPFRPILNNSNIEFFYVTGGATPHRYYAPTYFQLPSTANTLNVYDTQVTYDNNYKSYVVNNAYYGNAIDFYEVPNGETVFQYLVSFGGAQPNDTSAYECAYSFNSTSLPSYVTYNHTLGQINFYSSTNGVDYSNGYGTYTMDITFLEDTGSEVRKATKRLSGSITRFEASPFSSNGTDAVAVDIGAVMDSALATLAIPREATTPVYVDNCTITAPPQYNGLWLCRPMIPCVTAFNNEVPTLVLTDTLMTAQVIDRTVTETLNISGVARLLYDGATTVLQIELFPGVTLQTVFFAVMGVIVITLLLKVFAGG